MTSQKKEHTARDSGGGKCYHGVYSPPINLTHGMDGWQWVLVGAGEFIGTKRTIINSKILTDKKKDLLCEVYLMPCCEET